MAAVLGLDDEAVIAACDEASSIGIAEPVNFNSPGQVVIAGHKDAIETAIETLQGRRCAQGDVLAGQCAVSFVVDDWRRRSLKGRS